MKIAVTGATGGLGRSLTEFLIAQGHQVVALGRNREAGQALAAAGAEFRTGEITDTGYLRGAFAGCELVVHSAGLASPWGEWELFLEANVHGTSAVLQAMEHAGITRLVYLSTPSVYFSGRPIHDVREDSPLPPAQNFYSKSKIMADEIVLRETARRGLNSVLLRPRAIFGPYDKAILPRMLRVMRKGFFPLPDGGNSLVDLTAVENVIHAIDLVIRSPRVFRGEIFNITNAQPMTVRDLTSRLASATGLKVKFAPVPMVWLRGLAAVLEFFARHVTGREPVISRYGIGSLGTTQTLSVEKARRLLGYEPVISLEEAIGNFARTLRENG